MAKGELLTLSLNRFAGVVVAALDHPRPRGVRLM